MNTFYKCIALDLDGTTLHTGGVLSARTRAALEGTIAAGAAIAVASGRAFDSLPAAVMEIEGLAYAITSNGAAVHRLPSGECIRRCLLPPDAVETVLRIRAFEDVRYECFIEGRAYCSADYLADPVSFGTNADAVPYIQSTRRSVEDMPAFMREHAAELDSIDVIVLPAHQRRVWDWVRQERPDLYATSSVPQLVEIASREAGKRAGLETVLRDLGVSAAEAVAFGDADNDIDMIEFAGLGIAMENGTAAVKAAADRIAPHHNDDGVAQMLEKLYQLKALNKNNFD